MNFSFDINELFHRRGQDSISYPLNSMNLPNVNVSMNQRGFESGPFWQRNLSSKPIGLSSNGAPVEARLGGINSFSKPTMRPNDVQSLGQPFGWNNSNSRGSFKGTNSFVGGDNRFGNNQTQRSMFVKLETFFFIHWFVFSFSLICSHLVFSKISKIYFFQVLVMATSVTELTL